MIEAIKLRSPLTDYIIRRTEINKQTNKMFILFRMKFQFEKFQKIIFIYRIDGLPQIYVISDQIKCD